MICMVSMWAGSAAGLIGGHSCDYNYLEAPLYLDAIRRPSSNALPLVLVVSGPLVSSGGTWASSHEVNIFSRRARGMAV